jgi:peptidyl-dipeptidase A
MPFRPLLAITMVFALCGLAAAQPPAPPPTAADAEAFVARVEAELVPLNEYSARVSWIGENFITDDTMWLRAKVRAEMARLRVANAKQAARFDAVAVDPVTRRKLNILKQSLFLPPPDRPGAAQEMANLSVKIGSLYSTGKFSYRGKTLTLDDIEDVMKSSRDPAELKTLWEGWHAIAPPMRADYARLIALANEGARELGYAEAGVLARSWYDMPPAAFAAAVERLWSQLEPMYKNLQCYARGRLNDKYGDAVQPRTGPIRADLLGNMWAQSWSNVYDILAPANDTGDYDLSRALAARNYDVVRLVSTAESFYTSLGFAPLPPTFWTRSLLTRPRDREVNCHASAWDIDARTDLRVKACFKVDAESFYVAHHELGHVFYDRAYADQPLLFKGGANDGFHEAIGDFAALSALTPDYLHQIGLLDQTRPPAADIGFLLGMALDKLAFLPFAYIVDKWRWQVLAGTTPPARYNDDWWALRTKYQGVMPPGPRPADAFDPGAKAHIAQNTPYMRYFLAHIYQFQFYRAACRIAGWSGPLHRCSVYGNKEVGARFQAMLQMGASKPWPEALAAFTGERDLDASALTDYFAPLDRWLTEQNKGEKCG